MSSQKEGLMEVVGAGKSEASCYVVFAACLKGAGLLSRCYGDNVESCVLAFGFLSVPTLYDISSDLAIQFLFSTNLEGNVTLG